MIELTFAIIISLFSIVLTLVSAICYIHPGTHRGYADTKENINSSWKENITKNWRNFKDIPIKVNTFYSHFIRLWWWLITGTSLKEWIPVHRHNHFHADKKWKDGKPGSLVLANMYIHQSSNKELVRTYSEEIPNTWVDRNIYHAFPLLGPLVYIMILYILLGMYVIIPLIVQIFWIVFSRSEAVNAQPFIETDKNRLFHILKDREYFV